MGVWSVQPVDEVEIGVGETRGKRGSWTSQGRPYFPGQQEERRDSYIQNWRDSGSERGDCTATRGPPRKGQCNACGLTNQGWGKATLGGRRGGGGGRGGGNLREDNVIPL